MVSPAGTATVFYARRAFTATDLFLHNVGEYDLFLTPLWVTGGAIAIDGASGEVDIADLEVRRMRNDVNITGFNNGPILLDDETTVANLELITTYSDGSAITGGKYHKLLFGIISTQNGDKDFIVYRQGKPAVEYATRAAAVSDGEHKAGTSWGTSYIGIVFPIAYITMLKADASDLETIDLRATGVVGSGGGGAAIGDHSLLANLGVDTHAQYHNDARALIWLALQDHGVLAGLGDDDHLQYHTNTRALAWLATRSTTDLPEGAKLYFTDERAQDGVGGALTATNDITPVYNDGANTISANFTTTGNAGAVLAAGNNNNINIGTALLVRVTGPVAAFALTGFTGGYAGRQLFVYNTTGSNMQAINEDGGSLAGNRILILSSAVNATTSGTGIMEFIYSATDSRWIMVGIHS